MGLCLFMLTRGPSRGPWLTLQYGQVAAVYPAPPNLYPVGLHYTAAFPYENIAKTKMPTQVGKTGKNKNKK